MNKIVFLVLVALFISCGDKQPKIKIKNKKINIAIDSLQNSTSFYIYLENIGNDVLTIEKINTSCKCLAGFDEKINIFPKTKDSIKINYINDEKLNHSEEIVIISNTIPKINFVTVNVNIK
jgi:hypothetical protein